MKIVHKGLKLRIYPNKEIKEKIKLNMDNSRFVFNKVRNHIYMIKSLQYYDLHLNPSYNNFNDILNYLKSEYDFLRGL